MQFHPISLLLLVLVAASSAAQEGEELEYAVRGNRYGIYDYFQGAEEPKKCWPEGCHIFFFYARDRQDCIKQFTAITRQLGVEKYLPLDDKEDRLIPGHEGTDSHFVVLWTDLYPDNASDSTEPALFCNDGRENDDLWLGKFEVHDRWVEQVLAPDANDGEAPIHKQRM